MHGRLIILPPKWATPFFKYKVLIKGYQRLMSLHKVAHTCITHPIVETDSQRLSLDRPCRRESGRANSPWDIKAIVLAGVDIRQAKRLLERGALWPSGKYHECLPARAWALPASNPTISSPDTPLPSNLDHLHFKVYVRVSLRPCPGIFLTSYGKKSSDSCFFRLACSWLGADTIHVEGMIPRQNGGNNAQFPEKARTGSGRPSGYRLRCHPDHWHDLLTLRQVGGP